MSGIEAAKAQAMVKAIFDDNEAEINGRKYHYLKMTHKQRRKVFAFYSRIQNRIQVHDLSFLDTPEFETIEAIMLAAVNYNDSLLSVLGDAHWEKYATDYVTFITTSLAVISYPFFPAVPTDSASE